mmetsp:Transcript_20059/g.55215  ORF Transcript_20059/g.55215 Transcript_20059/m.55215 type:complete len:427 (-) Transcript_20059:173-1453(-)
MGCSCTSARAVSAPAERSKHSSESERVAQTPGEDELVVQSPTLDLDTCTSLPKLQTKPQTLRKWSVGSLDSACSLLSMERVAAGHGGTSILKFVDRNAEEVPDIPEFVMKVWDDVEACVYKELGATDDSLLPFTPGFFGEVDPDDLTPDLGGRYMRLSNVLHNFNANPNVMDCKLGIRSFTEEEVHKVKLREDLYKKLVDLDPTAPTAEERQAKACTKYRWMSSNDERTTLRSLGFRIDGLENFCGKKTKEQLRHLRGLSDVAKMITEDFLPAVALDTRSTASGGVSPLSGTDAGNNTAPLGIPGCRKEADGVPHPAVPAAQSVLSSLRSLREAMLVSELVRSHTFVGSSLLFVADAHGPAAGVYLIDFAHTTHLPPGVSIDHRSPWKAGNYEDGLLLGMDNMILCWEQVLAGLNKSNLCTAVDSL